jgi:hypothetical protein
LTKKLKAAAAASRQAGNNAACEVAREHAALTSETASADSRAKRSGKPGPRMSPAERDLLLKLLVAGVREGAIKAVFRSLGTLRRRVPPWLITVSDGAI